MPIRRRRAAALSILAGAAALTAPLAAAPATAALGHGPYVIEAHAGGLGYFPGDTMPAFRNALRMGASQLELDVQITRDGKDVVIHDRKISPTVCVDTAPVTTGDPQYPYVGKYVKDLTLAQVETIDCGKLTRSDMPQQQSVPGTHVPRLGDVLALVRRSHARTVKVSVELKVEAGSPTETAPSRQFVDVARKVIDRSGIKRQVNVRSFDWSTLRRYHAADPAMPLIALSQIEFFYEGSPWVGGVDIDKYGDDLASAARSVGATGIAPVHGNPQNGSIDDPGYQPFTTAKMIASAHRQHMKVFPWTVDDEPTMRALIAEGADGIDTDYPDRLRKVAAEAGYRLPPEYEPRG